MCVCVCVYVCVCVFKVCVCVQGVCVCACACAQRDKGENVNGSLFRINVLHLAELSNKLVKDCKKSQINWWNKLVLA